MADDSFYMKQALAEADGQQKEERFRWEPWWSVVTVFWHVRIT